MFGLNLTSSVIREGRSAVVTSERFGDEDRNQISIGAGQRISPWLDVVPMTVIQAVMKRLSHRLQLRGSDFKTQTNQ